MDPLTLEIDHFSLLDQKGSMLSDERFVRTNLTIDQMRELSENAPCGPFEYEPCEGGYIVQCWRPGEIEDVVEEILNQK